MFKNGTGIVYIAAKENVAPSTISSELHKLGVDIKMGQHHVSQLTLKYSDQFIQLVKQGPEAIIACANNRIWGIGVTDNGMQQVNSFCEFIRLHQDGIGVKETARRLDLHRSTVAEWREGTDQPYLIRAVKDTFQISLRPGYKMLPLHLVSGGSHPLGWIQVPEAIRSYDDVVCVVEQLRPLEETYSRAREFGLGRTQVDLMRVDLFGYLMGIMVGDSGKLGGAQNRYASMNLDLQFTKKQASNERLGEFVLLCANSLGLEMDRISDKPPTGATAKGKNPSYAYRWSSDRSPLIAWMFAVGLGLQWEETTTTHKLRMDWILSMPRSFRIRFVQGVADSDACVKRYEIVIASVPNTEFFAKVLQSLGLSSAHVTYESGLPVGTMVNCKQASTLPIFNELVKGYRFQRLLNYRQIDAERRISNRIGKVSDRK
jgi:hypothetical protein